MLGVVMTSAAQEITIAAAADLNYALKEIAGKYEKETGRRIRISFGSSGNLFVAIQNGAPYDLFFSADANYPKKLQDGGLAVPGSFYPYAQGALVLWVRNGSKVDLKKGIAALADPGVKKVAMANPRHAPYGRAAVAALRAAGIYDAIAGKLVLGENISQTAQFVQTGNADAGIVALSLALAPGMSSAGKYYVVPASLYQPIEQGAVVLAASPHKDAARQFIEFMKSPAAVQVMNRYGFRRPEASSVRR